MRCTKWIAFAAALGLLALSFLAKGPLLHPSALDHPWRTLLCFCAAFAFMLLPGSAHVRRRIRAALFDSSHRSFHGVLLLLGATAYALVSQVVFGAIPRLDDGMAALFQAKVFLHGAVTLPNPAHPEFFRIFGVLGAHQGLERWCGMYPPGWPALLTIGQCFGIPWIVAPLLGGALTVVVAAVGRTLYTDRIGRLAGIFCLLSPFVAVLSATHLSHTATALFLCLCLWLTLRLLDRDRWTYGLLAGLVWGGAFLCRPLTALVVGACLAVIPLYRWRKTVRNWRGVLAAILVVGAAGAAQAAYQHVSTGDFTKPGHVVGMGRRGKMGFVRLDWARTHTPALGLQHTIDRLQALNRRLHGAPWPSLLLALLPLLLWPARKEDIWLLLPLLALLGAYACYWYFEMYFPARYLFAATPMLFVLSARGYALLTDRLAARFPACSRLTPRPPSVRLCLYPHGQQPGLLPAPRRSFRRCGNGTAARHPRTLDP